MDEFRAELEAWLARADSSQAELSRRSGVPQNVISRWLGRNPTQPSARNLLKIAPVLGVSYENLMRMCGYLPTTARASEPVQTELAIRLARLGARLSKYPRPFWLAAIEANEKMADALDSLAEHPLSASGEAAFSACADDLRQHSDGSDRDSPNLAKPQGSFFATRVAVLAGV